MRGGKGKEACKNHDRNRSTRIGNWQGWVKVSNLDFWEEGGSFNNIGEINDTGERKQMEGETGK